MIFKFNLFYLLIIFFIYFHVQKKMKKYHLLKEKNLETQMIEVYNQAYGRI